MNFKVWLEEFAPLEPSEYDPPDEAEMDRIRFTPLAGDRVPDLNGDRYRLKMPMGYVIDFTIRRGARAGYNAVPHSLNSKFAKLFDARKFKDMLELLNSMKTSPHEFMKKQLLAYKEN